MSAKEMRSPTLTNMQLNTNFKDNFKFFFKPSYRMRKIKNKGAILIIVWCYLVTSTFLLLKYVGSSQYNDAIFYSTQAVIGLTLPLLGWLSDVRFGRYMVISCSLWILWISSVLYTVASVLEELVQFKYANIAALVLLITLGVGYGGFQANIVQFGTDQLTDASAMEIKAFVAWCAWTIASSELVMHFILTCVQYKLVAPLLVCCNLSIALILNICLKTLLIKEPTMQNPFKHVFKVVKYTIKHKHPRQRSAFTYCEDAIPSRIDLGKIKYGGPFTTEQVEDVKTFFRIISAITFGSAIFVFTKDWSSLNFN